MPADKAPVAATPAADKAPVAAAPAADKAPVAAAPAVDQALANYEASLGQFLGPKLYKLVSKELSFDRLAKHVDKAWDQALKGAAELIGDQGELTDAETQKLAQALVLQFGDLADRFVAGDGADLLRSLEGWGKDSPRQVALVALLAAAGAVAADAKIPDLKKKLKVTDDIEAKLAVSLGSLQNITLQSIKGEISYASTVVKATASMEWDKEKGTGGGLKVETKSLDLFGGDLSLVGTANYNRYEQPGGSYDNKLTYGAGGKWSRDNLSVGLNASHDHQGQDKIMATVGWKF